MDARQTSKRRKVDTEPAEQKVESLAGYPCSTCLQIMAPQAVMVPAGKTAGDSFVW